MFLNRKKTERGFERIDFDDLYGVKCSIQESGLATQEAIWFGPDDPNPRVMNPGKGWQKVEIPGLLCDTRMHLNRKQVSELIPILQKFVETGEI